MRGELCISVAELFLREGGDSSLKLTHFEKGRRGVTYKTKMNGQEGRRVKNCKFRANVLFE